MAFQRRLFLPAFFLLCLCISALGQDGMYVDFATSMGNFTCKLEFQKTPRTVASFVGLVTGKPWLDLKTGAIRQSPFYNGLTFHRVVSGFVIQGGSPAGDGTDGPGYRIRDEFDATLRHSKAGILSMAHSGKGTQTNGSQFFITLNPTPSLDDVHSVFGEVTSGLEVVNAIGAVAVDANSKPLVPVVMQNVTIRRVGAAAQAFDEAAYGVPLVKGTGPTILREAGKTYLSFPWALHADYQFFSSTNLTTWSRQRLGFSGSVLPTGNLEVTNVIGTATQQFYRLAQVIYPVPSLEPTTLTGSSMQYTFSNGQIVTLQFTGASTGTFTLNTPATTGAIQSYTWTRENDIYEARLFCTLETLGALTFNPVFGTASSGIFKYGGGSSTSGTFTYTPPAAPFTAQAAESSPVTLQDGTSSTVTIQRSTRRAKRTR